MSTQNLPRLTLSPAEKFRERLLRFIWSFRAPDFVVLTGGPGAGKGSVSSRLAPRLGLAHVSTGSLLRSEVERGTSIGQIVGPQMEAGDLVADEITIYLLRKELIKLSNWRGAILDGFPRSIGQAELLVALLTSWKQPLRVVINIDVSREDLIERLSGRRTCSNNQCGRTYHVTLTPPAVDGVCDACGSALFIRPDDDPAAVSNRLVVYTEKSAPLVGWFDERHLLERVTSTNSGGIEDVVTAAEEIIRNAR